jgi:hypothetical protein
MVLAAMYGAGARTAAAYNKRVNFNTFFKGVARVTKTFTLEIGPLRATGVPAVLVGLTGIVLAAGTVRTLAEHSERLPETLREARALAQTLRPEAPQLRS